MHLIFARAYQFGREKDVEDVKKKLASANPGSIVVAVRAGSVSNEFLVEMIAAQTLRALASRSLLAKKPEVDMLLRLAGTTQISKAIKAEGALVGNGFVAINAGASELDVPPGFRRAELARRALTESELQKVEAAALLDAEKG